MLTRDVLDVFAQLDTSDQAAALRDWQVIDTPAGDTVLGFLAGNYPERYDALLMAIGSES